MQLGVLGASPFALQAALSQSPAPSPEEYHDSHSSSHRAFGFWRSGGVNDCAKTLQTAPLSHQRSTAFYGSQAEPRAAPSKGVQGNCRVQGCARTFVSCNSLGKWQQLPSVPLAFYMHRNQRVYVLNPLNEPRYHWTIDETPVVT